MYHHVISNYYLTVDSANFVVCEKKFSDKKNEYVYNQIAYLGSLKQFLTFFEKRLVLDALEEDSNALSTLNENLIDILTNISEAFKRVKNEL